MTDPDKPTLAWRLFRAALFAYLGRAARTILLSRALITDTGQQVRWLAPDVRRFLDQMKQDIEKLRPVANFENMPNAGNRIMVELAVMTIAAYRALAYLGVDRANSREVVADIGWKVYSSQLRIASFPFRLVTRDPGKRLHITIRMFLRFPFSAPGAPGYDVKSWSKSGDIYTYFSHCPPHTFVRSLISEQGDNGELQAFRDSWCQYDWPGADIIAGDGQRGHYFRSRTLSAGDNVCDMCWKRSSFPNQQ